MKAGRPRNINRDIADLSGDKFYEGSACPRGHTTRYTSNKGCCACTNARGASVEGRATAKISRIKNRAARLAKWAKQYAADPEKFRARTRKWAKNNPDKIQKTNRNWREANPEKKKADWRKWKKTPKGKEAGRRWSRSLKAAENRHQRWLQLAPDSNERISKNLRSRINMALRTKRSRAGSAVRDLGCTIPEFRAYIEKQFCPGMSWQNWTTDGWHLDHKMPLAKFDLTNREQFLQAAHYTNYQPLWAQANLAKHTRFDARSLWEIAA